jgi:uncharacterized repeat protein (TIGR03943 family)
VILRTQGVVLALLGGVCARLALTDAHLRYVNGWMKWPLLATAVVLIVLAVRVVLLSGKGEEERVPAASWLLLAPIVAVFVISPPALGAYTAERNSVDVAAEQEWEGVREGTAMKLGEFQSRAQWDETLRDRQVTLLGFVTRDPGQGGGWVLNRLSMSCCAADTVGYQVRVEGVATPPVETWVEVTGQWLEPETTERPRPGMATLEAVDVQAAQEPAQPYE